MSRGNSSPNPKTGFNLYENFREPSDHIKEISNYPRAHKREDSTSNTHTLNDSSFEISPNSSGIILLEHLGEIKKLFELQGRELDLVGQALSNQKSSERIREMNSGVNIGQSESVTSSAMNQNSLLTFPENSRQMISPVPGDIMGSDFASSLLSVSDYQLKITDVRYDNELVLSFLRGRYKPLNFYQKSLLASHIISLRL